jgi:hypothetical protein
VIVCATPLSSTSKSAAVNPVTGRRSRRTEASTLTTSALARNLGGSVDCGEP